MTPHQRLTRQARGLEVDRIPSIGGWMLNARTLAGFAGLSVEQYLADPPAGVVRANQALGVDAMVPPIIPDRLDQIRAGLVEESRFADIEPEALRDHADELPDTEKQLLAGVDRDAIFKGYYDLLAAQVRDLDGVVLLPTFWEVGGAFALYGQYGYEAFFLACSMYPEAVGKIWWADSVVRRVAAEALVKVYRELNLAPLLFTGHDVCNNKGLMVSPEFLRRAYWPCVRRIVEPLVDAGLRLIHHCDGDVRAVIDDMIAAGFSGFQGFQYEVGVDPLDLKTRRSLLGEEMLFFAGLSVSRTLPLGTPDDVRDEVDYFFDVTDAGRGLFLFTSNVTGVEVPPENIRAGYEHVKTLRPGHPRENPHTSWPWLAKHPE